MMTIKKCPEESRLIALVRCELSDAECAEVESHLSKCATCREKVAAWERIGVGNMGRFSSGTGGSEWRRANEKFDAFLESDTPLPLPLDVGTYRLLEPLGHGGMGDLYLAEHTVLKRRVAVKFIRRKRLQNLRAVERFQKEILAAGKLVHPNIVTATDAGTFDGTPYLVMELLHGQTLSEYVRSHGGKLRMREACEITRQAANALKYAHEQGFIHCDVKPANLWRTNDGTVKVLDFGLAHSMVELDAGETRVLAGTPDFLPPEQMVPDAVVDARADIYALGCVLFYLLTGNTASDCLRKNLPFPDAKAVGVRISSRLQKLLYRATDVSPLRRPRSMAEVLDALEPRKRYVLWGMAPVVWVVWVILLILLFGSRSPKETIQPDISLDAPFEKVSKPEEPEPIEETRLDLLEDEENFDSGTSSELEESPFIVTSPSPTEKVSPLFLKPVRYNSGNGKYDFLSMMYPRAAVWEDPRLEMFSPHSQRKKYNPGASYMPNAGNEFLSHEEASEDAPPEPKEWCITYNAQTVQWFQDAQKLLFDTANSEPFLRSTNYQQAAKILQKASDLGNWDALNFQWEAWRQNVMIPESTDALISRMKKASEQSIPEALLNMGLYYWEGRYTPRDVHQAYELFKKGAHWTSAEVTCECLYYLGKCSQMGEGTPKDIAKAKQYFYWSNTSAALFELGMMEIKKKNPDWSAAYHYFTQSKNYPKSCYMLGYFYEKGMIGEPDVSTARTFYGMALFGEQNRQKLGKPPLLTENGVEGYLSAIFKKR